MALSSFQYDDYPMAVCTTLFVETDYDGISMKPLIPIILAALLSGSICTPKPERSDIEAGKGAPQEEGTSEEAPSPEGERAGSGYW
jgi:hypothetical protein